MSHRHLLDNYSHLDSPVHRLPAWAKMLAAVALVVVLVTAPPSAALYVSATLALVLVAAVSRVPAAFLLKRLLLLEPFVLGVAVLVLMRPDGLRLFGIVLIRSTLCIAAMVLLSNTTPFSQMLLVLRRVRVPVLMVTTLALMYRYLYVLQDEAARMRTARASRTFDDGRRRTWHGLSTVVAQLFVRASARSERIYAAMCSRGWG